MFDYLTNYKRFLVIPPGAIRGAEYSKGSEAYRVTRYPDRVTAQQLKGEPERLQAVGLYLELKGYKPKQVGDLVTIPHTPRKAKEARGLVDSFIVALLDEIPEA